VVNDAQSAAKALQVLTSLGVRDRFHACDTEVSAYVHIAYRNGISMSACVTFMSSNAMLPRYGVMIGCAKPP